MGRPHLAAVVEDAYHDQIAEELRERGWGTRIVAHPGYGSEASIRVLGRVLMSRPRGSEGSGHDDEGDERAGAEFSEALREAELETRGWRAFVAAPAIDVPITVSIGSREIESVTDRGGLIDVTIHNHGLGAGWHEVRVTSPDAEPVNAPVLVVGSDQALGILSDIDDTVLSTSLPRPLIAAWNTFVRVEGARRPVSGMATLYREILRAHPGAPVVYLSTGAWNTAPWLTRFLRRNGYPAGPMLLTDWGPTNTGWFRSGREHKRASLHRLARELPHVQWLLVGDDGQHDPKIYTEFAAARPDRVRAIAIRELTPGQQVLSHWLPVANDDLAPAPTENLTVPFVRAPDGFGLARQLRSVLGLTRTSRPGR